ncbi:MAG: endonuclease/exonuclease/phosphatase family protein [Thermaurantiacus tibetensis]|uniref:endonuclease/exonuclease/phosphatase family protein n=1 Tax=Thermaurantiacus tibetensis TaxID=2759035 RepID=UPI002E2A8B5A|nr:endonuclease/exonuclease/phosphatase family protein [Thermaurantiacus tibetensis]
MTAAAEIAAAARVLVAASYNIHKGVGSDGLRQPARILDVLDEIGADLAVLQEADHRFGIRHAVLPPALVAERGWRPVPFDRAGVSLGWHGNAILVRGGLDVARHRRIRLPALEPRGAVLADVCLGPRLLRVVGMHLDLSGLRRLAQVRAILRRVAAAPGDPPLLLMGDLNAWRADDPALGLLASGLMPVALPPSFPARLPLGRLDRVFTSRGVEVLEAGVHASATARAASDHLPVWVRLALPAG